MNRRFIGFFLVLLVMTGMTFGKEGGSVLSCESVLSLGSEGEFGGKIRSIVSLLKSHNLDDQKKGHEELDAWTSSFKGQMPPVLVGLSGVSAEMRTRHQINNRTNGWGNYFLRCALDWRAKQDEGYDAAVALEEFVVTQHPELSRPFGLRQVKNPDASYSMVDIRRR